jgi:hypothetical protein
MRGLIQVVAILGTVALSVAVVTARPVPLPADDHGSIVIIFKDGHRQGFAVGEITSIEFKAPTEVIYKDGHKEKIPAADIARIEFGSSDSSSTMPSRAHFVGKVGSRRGSNGGRFFITLDADGSAEESWQSSWNLDHGRRRSQDQWDDGWHDAIRKVGSKHEKFAYGPGKSFEDTPSNVTPLRNTQPKPI